jgi:hypothetical protein
MCLTFDNQVINAKLWFGPSRYRHHNMAQKKLPTAKIIITLVLLLGAGLLIYWRMNQVDESAQLEQRTHDLIEALNRKDWLEEDRLLKGIWPDASEGCRISVDPQSRMAGWTIKTSVDSRDDLIAIAKNADIDNVTIKQMTSAFTDTGINLLLELSSSQKATDNQQVPSKWKLVFRRNAEKRLVLEEIVLQ